jgi:hypothetical protein
MMNPDRARTPFLHPFPEIGISRDSILNSLNLHPYNLANRLATKLHDVVVELKQGSLYQPVMSLVEGFTLIIPSTQQISLISSATSFGLQTVTPLHFCRIDKKRRGGGVICKLYFQFVLRE